MTLVAQLHDLLENELPPEAQVALLTSMSDEPLTGEALFQAVQYLYQRAGQGDQVCSALDIVGTGGDGKNLFNISTASSFVIAGAGVPVLKHGNTGVSSRCGSIDCLKALRVALPQDKPAVLQQFRQTGISFLFAPQFYPLLAKVKAARQALAKQGRYSVFNILGPLLNPLSPSHQLLGVAKTQWVAPMAEAMLRLGRRGFVFCCAGTDELVPHPEMQIMAVDDSDCKPYHFDYQAYGFTSLELEDLQGAESQDNAQTLLALLQNQLQGPVREVVLLNAAFAIAAYQAIAFAAAYKKAQIAISDGAALAKLKSLQEPLL